MIFTTSHEWVSLKGKRATIGITQHAQEELGEIVSVELPKPGEFIKAGEVASILESTKAAIDIHSPISGEVVAVNEALRQNPALIAESPESLGWLFQLENFSSEEVDKLLTLAQYREYLEN
ncbi:MAG: glycine cleavage system protein GcvH [Verrucomicrobiota bacterium]|nr:glycine cleavage system protein GcvH [Verrucomicrobiota bacterium]